MASCRLACLSTRYNKPFSGCKVTNFLPNGNKYVLSIFRHKEYLTLFNFAPYVLQGRPLQNIPNESAKKMRTRSYKYPIITLSFVIKRPFITLSFVTKRPFITLSFVIKHLFITLSFVIKHPFITLSFITKHPFITLSFRSKIGREGFYEQYVFADAQSAEAYRNGYSLFSRKFWYIRES